MGETTHIEWADSTLNCWEGCQETGSPACVGCYAKARNLRYAPKGTAEAPNWGPHAPRREVKSWRSTLRKISRMAKEANRPWFVFVNSLSDFWDNQADPVLRAEALAEFAKHPHLTFLLLTKRPQMIVKLWLEVIRRQRADDGIGGEDPSDGQLLAVYKLPANIALGCTVVTQKEAVRDLPWLQDAKIALRPAFTFVSMEPLAEVVDISPWLPTTVRMSQPWSHADVRADYGRLDWVITGGATDQGKVKAYPTPYGAFRKVRDDCAAAGVAYLHKQNGEWVQDGGGYADIVESAGTPPWIDWGDGRKLFVTERTPPGYRGYLHRRVGKKAAGRMLDGRTHDERPSVAFPWFGTEGDHHVRGAA